MTTSPTHETPAVLGEGAHPAGAPSAPASVGEEKWDGADPVGPERASGPIEIVDYDEDWPVFFAAAAARVRAALAADALAVEHVGSTAVPGLAAKPVIDINLAVADSAREEAYAPRLVAAGFELVVREPEWFEHRMFKASAPRVNLHVFSLGCPEAERMRLFRDWLRRRPEDAALYASVKRRLAEAPWEWIQGYADAKSGVVAEIMGRALEGAARDEGP